MRRLIWDFAGRTYNIVGNLMSRLKWCSVSNLNTPVTFNIGHWTLIELLAKSLIILRVCAGRSEPLLVAHTTLLLVCTVCDDSILVRYVKPTTLPLSCTSANSKDLDFIRVFTVCLLEDETIFRNRNANFICKLLQVTPQYRDTIDHPKFKYQARRNNLLVPKGVITCRHRSKYSFSDVYFKRHYTINQMSFYCSGYCRLPVFKSRTKWKTHSYLCTTMLWRRENINPFHSGYQ